MTFRSSTFAALGLSTVVAAALFTAWLLNDSTRVLATIQLIVAPLLLICFSGFSFLGVKVPRLVLGAAVIGTLTGAVVTYSHVDLAPGAFVVSRFADDELETVTKITRDRMRQGVGWRGLTMIGTHHQTITSHGEASALLQRNGDLGGVIWGSPRWLNVSLQQTPPVSVRALLSEAINDEYRLRRRLPDLKLLTSIPIFGISGSAEYPTVNFLGRLALAWRHFFTVISHPDARPEFELQLRSMAGVKGRWTAYSHRAVPMWMTGTYHLTQALSHSVVEAGEINCALGSFEAALSQLRPGDNRDLEIAILNNHAVALIVKSLLAGNRLVLEREAMRLLAQVSSVTRTKQMYETPIGSLAVVKENLLRLKGKNE
jgi:hypothetical protein